MAFSNDPLIIVRYGLFFNTKEVTYSGYGTDVHIPVFESSDGPTLNFFTRMFFSQREILLGTDAALVHDYMCRHKDQYDRKTSSRMLRDIWIACGLNKIKGYMMYGCVDFYQWLRHGKEWKS